MSDIAMFNRGYIYVFNSYAQWFKSLRWTLSLNEWMNRFYWLKSRSNQTHKSYNYNEHTIRQYIHNTDKHLHNTYII